MTLEQGAALTGGVALLERAMGYTLGSLLLVAPWMMANPTPCRAWDLHDLLLHMDDSLRVLQEAILVGDVELRPAALNGVDGELSSLGPVASLRSRSCQMIGAWANATAPGTVAIANRRLTSPLVAATGAIEVAAHGWDVARACGCDRPVPPALAEELLEVCPFVVRDRDRGTLFAAPVDVSPRATPSDRLVAFLGRHPR